MAKTALVISGGGSKGAFAVGAIEVLHEQGVQFDLVTGTSTGALIAPLVATGDVALLHSSYTSVRTEDIVKLRSGIDILSGDSLHDSKPLWNLVNQNLNAARYEKLLASAIDVFVCATNLQDGKAHYWNPKCGLDKKPLSRDTFARAVFASASEPVLMPAVRVPYETGDQYVDGGVREVIPLRKAIQEGADCIYAIVLSPATRTRHTQTYHFVVDTLMRTLDMFLEEILRNDLEDTLFYNELLGYVASVRQRAAAYIPADKLDEVFAAPPALGRALGKRRLELHVIRPASELPASALVFDPATMSKMLQLGRDAALALFA